jgi:hypothetical protein
MVNVILRDIMPSKINHSPFTIHNSQLYFALIENRSFLTSKNSGSQFNRSIVSASCGGR